MKTVRFYIVTPTFNSLAWLPQCIRSVADQAQDVIVHHHVQDGGSTDGTIAWLEDWASKSSSLPNYVFTWESAHDDGMYDAINKAWARMPEDTDWTAHINSDEQYLPGVLAEVARKALQKPKTDVLLASYLILDKDARYIAQRFPIRPKKWLSWLNCCAATNSCFHRAESFRKHGIRFDIQWKSIGDLVFYRDMVRAGIRFDIINQTTSAFICTGVNLAWCEKSMAEERRYHRMIPSWAPRWQCVIYRWINLKRMMRSMLHHLEKRYSVYVSDSDQRKEFMINQPTVRWKLRMVSQEREEA